MTAIARISPAEPANLILDRAGLITALTNATKVVPKTAVIPILGCVKIQKCEGGVEVTGTDETLFVRSFVRGHAPAGLVMTLNPHRMLQILKKVPKQNDVKFVPKTDGSYSCFAGGVEVGLNPTPDAADFPTCASDDRLKAPALRFSLPASDIEAAFERLNRSVSFEETRYYLNGVFLRSHPSLGCLEMISTDGHRITRYRFPEMKSVVFTEGAIIPRDMCREIGRIAARADVEGLVEFMLGDTDIRVTFATGETLTSGLVDGTYPDFERVIPQKTTTQVTVGAWNLVDAINRAAAITVLAKGVQLTMSANKISCTVRDEDIGSSTTEVAAECTGDAVFGVDRAYLKDMLEPMERSARLGLNEIGSPMLIHDLSDDRFTGALMPLKV